MLVGDLEWSEVWALSVGSDRVRRNLGALCTVLQLGLRHTGLLLERLPLKPCADASLMACVTALILRPNLIQVQSLRSGAELTPQSTPPLDTLLEGE
jgi:hypothetical protein